MKVRIGIRAQQELAEISDWIAADSPEVAASFTARLREKALHIGELPYGFPKVGRWRGLDVRKRTYRDYRIFYYVTRSSVTITRVLHASRDYSVLFK